MSDHAHLLLDSLAALCGAPDSAVLLSALFLAGLAGGFSHCAGMCGPFVLTQVSHRLAAVDIAEFGVLARLKGAAVMPYHLGRATTYALLGAAAAWTTGRFVGLTEFCWVSSLFLLLAAALFVGSLVAPARWLPASPARILAVLSRWASPLFATPQGWRGYGLGLTLGFLPCSLVYSALAAAAAGGNPLTGAVSMTAFAAGTFPALAAVGYVGIAAGRRWRGAVGRLAKPMMAVNAALLAAVALRGLL